MTGEAQAAAEAAAVRGALSGPLAAHLAARSPNAGLHMATLLRNGLGEDEVMRAAAGHGIGMMGLHHFFHASPPQQGLLLGFGAVSTTDLPAALRALGGVLTSAYDRHQPAVLPGKIMLA